MNYKNLINEILIAKRLNFSDEDWNYEIVFPIDYNGTFNQM